jgi:hypothetical protein
MKILNIVANAVGVKVKLSTCFSRAIFAVGLIALLGACSSGSSNSNSGLPPAALPFQELVDQGVTRYMGEYSPSTTAQVGNSIEYSFGVGDGPLCLRGTPYTMATRDSGSDDLMIFLQGGGACWFDLCAANETADAQLPIPKSGIFAEDPARSPLAGTSTVYVPYCDGGLHASDAEYDSDNDGVVDLYHHGLQNLSASLDVSLGVFPAPSRIVLAGVSGGGYGALFALSLVSQAYPGVPIDVLNDSGIGITRPEDPEFNLAVVEYWNTEAFFPASVPGTLPEGSPTTLLNWQLQQDPNISMGMLSYKQDAVIGTFFLGIGGPAFEGILLPTMADAQSANPQRMRSYIADGDNHTFLGGDLSLSVDGVTLFSWIDAMINGPRESWQSVSGAPTRDE